MCSCGSFWIGRTPAFLGVINGSGEIGIRSSSTRLHMKTSGPLQACSTKRLIWDAGLINDPTVK